MQIMSGDNVLTNVIVIIILQYTGISNYHIIHLKLIQTYASFILTNLEKQICPKP